MTIAYRVDSALAEAVNEPEQSLNLPIFRAEDAGPRLKGILSKYRGQAGAADALQRCLDLIDGKGPDDVMKALAQFSPAWRDHAIASVYAVMMPGERRKRLGAYFTPPHLVDHLVSRLESLGLDLATHRVRDPAAGGAAFLVPLARRKVYAWRQAGLTDREIVARLPEQLFGSEIDPDLAKLANALLRRMLIEEFRVAKGIVDAVEIVATRDSLTKAASAEAEVDHEIGNPPYFRLPRAQKPEVQAEFSDIANGRLNLYAMFLRRALDHVPPGGLVGYVIPASFLGGPEFKTFRSRVTQLAEVLVIDLVEKRSDVFLDATQDACFVVLRRRPEPIANCEQTAALSGVLRADGDFRSLGNATVAGDGEPWRLPGDAPPTGQRLSEWGYRGSIGHLVANRQPERLHAEAGPDRFPLVWAKAISPEGTFDFKRGVEHKKRGWVDAPPSAPYIVRSECVAVQRTSSRGQKRRITAAAVPQAFIDAHGGIIAENHVILLVPLKSDARSAEALAAALNEPEASAQLDQMCGSASISVRLLELLLLPPSAGTETCDDHAEEQSELKAGAA